MTQAVYFSSGSVPKDQFLHYGLAMPIYTHFTSPIRRYADVIVHRLLGCAIGVYRLAMNLDNYKVSKLCEVINFRHRMAQYASRSSVELHTVIFFRGKIIVEDGYVTRVKANGFSVLIPK
jgi:exosome complex exonuclease DIS3/RRP44